MRDIRVNNSPKEPTWNPRHEESSSRRQRVLVIIVILIILLIGCVYVVKPGRKTSSVITPGNGDGSGIPAGTSTIPTETVPERNEIQATTTSAITSKDNLTLQSIDQTLDQDAVAKISRDLRNLGQQL